MFTLIPLLRIVLSLHYVSSTALVLPIVSSPCHAAARDCNLILFKLNTYENINQALSSIS